MKSRTGLRLLAQPLQKLRQVGREAHAELQTLSGDGVLQAQLRGVQGDAGGAAVVGEGLPAERLVVHPLAADDVSLFGEMNADLMRPSRFELAFDQRVLAQILERPDVRHGMLADVLERGAAAPTVPPV